MAEMTPELEKKMLKALADNTWKQASEAAKEMLVAAEQSQEPIVGYQSQKQKWFEKLKNSMFDYGDLDLDAKYVVALHTNEYTPLPPPAGEISGGSGYTHGNNTWTSAGKAVTFSLNYGAATFSPPVEFPVQAKTGGKSVRVIGGPFDGKVYTVKEESKYVQWVRQIPGKGVLVESLEIHKHLIDDTWYVMWDSSND